jgi:hypothetical protein
MTLWWIEVRKHIPFFASIIGAVTGTSVAAAIWPDTQMLAILRSICGLLCWTGAVVYVSTNVVRFVTLGGDLLMHISSLNPWRLLGMKSAVLGTFMLCLHIVSVVGQWRELADTSRGESPEVFTYLFFAKLVSIAAFLIAVALAATLAKVIRGRGPAVAAFGVLVFAMIVLQTIALWRLGAPHTSSWFIGIGGDMYTVNLYANILPLILTGPELGILPALAWVSVAFNAACAILGIMMWAVLARLRRFDFAAV